ncbi:MAG: Ig-like domain-containing protein, partial [Ruminiclostridium sp.]|nr:Ig-like domain-containing protein [Ruminiclostridium sp.]
TVPVEEVTLDQTSLFLKVDDTATLTATVKPTDSTDKTVTWTTDDDTVATVANGVVTAVGKGKATVTAKVGGKSATCTVTVIDPAKEIFVEPITVLVGEEKAVIITVDPADAKIDHITYTSSNEKIFTITDGKVKGVSKGTATLTVTAANEGNTKLTAECTVTVTDNAIAATAITISETAVKLEVEETKTLTATLTPADSTDKITWISSDETIVSVDETGKITALKVGEATITAKANETVSAQCKVTVTAKTIAVESITLDKTSAELIKGDTLELTATVKPDDATDKTVTWTSSDEKVATVDENGKVTAVGGGKATITAKAGSKSATCEVIVTIPVTSVTLNKNELSLEKGESAELTATVEPEDATDKTVTWTSSDEKVATVDENGKVTAIAAGAATITAKAGDKSATCEVTVTVPVTGITLDKTELSLEKGESAELTAAVEPEDATDKTITWTSSDEKVATVDENGKVTAIAAGTATITAKAGDMSATCSITVTEKAEDTKPDVTEPDVTEPGVTEPDATEPNTSNDGKDDENNKPTGVAIALVPAVTAAAAAVIFKKRK